MSPTRALGVMQLLGVQCDCGVLFAWPSHVSLAQCPGCRAERVVPRPPDGMWPEPPLCMACGAECGVECVLPNGNMSPWIVCMTCYRAEDECDEA